MRQHSSEGTLLTTLRRNKVVEIPLPFAFEGLAEPLLLHNGLPGGSGYQGNSHPNFKKSLFLASIWVPKVDGVKAPVERHPAARPETSYLPFPPPTISARLEGPLLPKWGLFQNSQRSLGHDWSSGYVSPWNPDGDDEGCAEERRLYFLLCSDSFFWHSWLIFHFDLPGSFNTISYFGRGGLPRK